MTSLRQAPLCRQRIDTVQVNLGKVCNQAIVRVLDITGGAPELNPNFRWMVARGALAGWEVIDRCNLTILFERGMEDVPELTLTNLPVSRFRDSLERRGELRAYEKLLMDHFDPDTVSGLMCMSQLNIGWNGDVFDCDFNQMLELPSCTPSIGQTRPNVMTMTSFNDLKRAKIATGTHCFGCTAGAGSSCGGAIS